MSPDGQRIAYASFDDQKRPSTAVCDLPTCASQRTFPIGERHSGRRTAGLAYVDPRTRSDIWVQPLDGGAPRQLTHFAADGQQS